MAGESTAYAKLREKICGAMDRIDRIENPLVPGMFDVNLCLNSLESWIEIKCPKEPVRPATALFASNHKVSQEQKNWALRQRNAGGRCFFLFATDKRWLLLPGHVADGINEMPMREIMQWSLWRADKPVLAIQWADLKELLSRK